MARHLRTTILLVFVSCCKIMNLLFRGGARTSREPAWRAECSLVGSCQWQNDKRPGAVMLGNGYSVMSCLDKLWIGHMSDLLWPTESRASFVHCVGYVVYVECNSLGRITGPAVYIGEQIIILFLWVCAPTGWPKNMHISICLMLNWYSFVKFQPNFIIFGRLLWFPTKQCIYCPQHLLRVSTLPCRNSIVRYLCCLKMKFVDELCWQTTK